MRRIEFIAPVEAMRGNLSGAQKLQYPTDNQGAYEGPEGSKNYARNYSPRFVGAKRASDGRKYFSVRTKSANHLTAKSKTAMALMGGTGAIVGYILGHKSEVVYTDLMACWLKAQELGDKRTFRQFVSFYVREMLIAKQPSKELHIGSSTATIDNPWNTTESSPNVAVSRSILIKFWSELAANGIEFTVAGYTGIAHREETFGDVINSAHNVLDLDTYETTVSGQTKTLVMLNTQYLLYPSQDYVQDSSVITANTAYILTDDAPASGD